MEFELNLCDRDRFDYIVGIGPLIAALIAVGIAWWQGKIQKRQHNLSLFKERWKIKKQLEDILPDLYASSTEGYEHLSVNSKIFELINISEYLFNKEISQKMEEIRKLYLNIKAKNNSLKSRTKRDVKIEDAEWDEVAKKEEILYEDLRKLTDCIDDFLKRKKL